MDDAEQPGRNQSGSNGPKAFAAAVTIVAVIAGVYAMVEPMSQRMDFLERQLAQVREDLAGENARQLEDRGHFSSMKEKFREVETQFRGLREVVDTRFNGHLQGGHPHSVELQLAELRAHFARLETTVEERTGEGAGS